MEAHQPHLRLTAEEVKDLYDKKLINARGLVYLYLTASRKKGWKLRGYVAQLAQELGISERQFYRAIKDLSALNLIDFTIHGEISIWATESSITDLESLRNPDDSAKPVRDFDNLVRDFDKVVSDSDKVVSKKAPKPSEEADSSVPSTLYNSLQSLSPSPPATLREREEKENPNIKKVKAEFTRVTDEEKSASEGTISAAAKNSEKKEISDLELLEFIERQNPNVRSPKAYARACLKNDRNYWLQEYQSWQARKQESDQQWEAYQAYQEYKPDPPVTIDPEQARDNIRRIREMLSKGI